MLFVFAVVLVFLVYGAGSVFLRKHNTRIGHGMGKISASAWGIEENTHEYHY